MKISLIVLQEQGCQLSSQQQMENILKEDGKDDNLVILDTSFLIYS